jgi:hypothetical protein
MHPETRSERFNHRPPGLSVPVDGTELNRINTKHTQIGSDRLMTGAGC